jgi:hypothetical protein
MAEYKLRLPDRKPAVAALSRLDGELGEAFAEELLHALWDCHEAGNLPDEVVLVMRDWLARASLNASPEFHDRLAKARNGTAT